MTNHEAIQFLKNMQGEENGRAIGTEGFYAELCGYHVQALGMAIKALEQEPCEDAISRKAAIDAMYGMHMNGKDGVIYDHEHLHGTEGDFSNTILDAVEELEQLPPVTPQPKIGRWVESYINQIKGRDDIGHFYVCNDCGRYINLRQGAKLSDYPYCHCGAKMEVDG